MVKRKRKTGTQKRSGGAGRKRSTKAKSKVRAKKGGLKKSGAEIRKRGTKDQLIGIVTHFFPKVNAAVVRLKRPLALGDWIAVKGATTNFNQKVESLQIDRVDIKRAKAGDEIGLGVKERVRAGDQVSAFDPSTRGMGDKVLGSLKALLRK